MECHFLEPIGFHTDFVRGSGGGSQHTSSTRGGYSLEVRDKFMCNAWPFFEGLVFVRSMASGARCVNDYVRNRQTMNFERYSVFHDCAMAFAQLIRRLFVNLGFFMCLIHCLKIEKLSVSHSEINVP